MTSLKIARLMKWLRDSDKILNTKYCYKKGKSCSSFTLADGKQLQNCAGGAVACAYDMGECAKVTAEQTWAVFDTIFSVLTLGASSGFTSSVKAAADVINAAKSSSRVARLGGKLKTAFTSGLDSMVNILETDAATLLTEAIGFGYDATGVALSHKSQVENLMKEAMEDKDASFRAMAGDHLVDEVTRQVGTSGEYYDDVLKRYTKFFLNEVASQARNDDLMLTIGMADPTGIVGLIEAFNKPPCKSIGPPPVVSQIVQNILPTCAAADESNGPSWCAAASNCPGWAWYCISHFAYMHQCCQGTCGLVTCRASMVSHKVTANAYLGRPEPPPARAPSSPRPVNITV